MFLGLLLAGATVIGLSFGGAWLSGDDLATANAMVPFKALSIRIGPNSMFELPMINLDFFFSGFKALMTFDFAFFVGPLQILQWFMVLTIGVATMWGLYSVAIWMLQGVFGRR